MKSEAIRREIKDFKTGANDASVTFWNGSTIECVTSSDNSRGYRSHVLVLDEYRMIKKDVLDSFLRKFLKDCTHFVSYYIFLLNF